MEQDIMGLISAQEEEYRDADDEEEEARKLYLKQDVSNFSNLEELTITNIYGDLNIWRRQLVHLLKSSPNLRHLHLGLSYNVVERHCHDGLHELFTDFFDEICNDFTQSGCSPLKLRSLGCGTCFLPQSVTALHKLTEMEYLEELYIRNENISTHTDWFFIYDDDGTSFIPFDSILSRACPRLRRFSAHQLAKDVVDALASDQALPILPQLAVFIESQDIWDEEMALLLQADLDHPALPLKLRMMDLDLDRGQRGEPSAEQILDNLVATNAETLQGLAVHLTGTPGNFEDLDALQKALRQLPHLTQFMIVYKSHFGGFEEDECLRTAEKIANAVPQLRYISVYGHYWAIWHVSDGETSASLERLEEPSEREHVELFVHDTFTP
ncbi:hypothetical protein GQ53DRAFT_835616 [Thozetella sp. PMI_491]|nr:hypothetical protein GQ53DRAFT_835616 [Thozetella sp. PMI_491]